MKRFITLLTALCVAGFVLTAQAQNSFVITGGSSTLTATESGATIGTPNQSIYDVLTTIRTHAGGNACTIQFGPGSLTWLNIGNNSAEFTNTGGTWGTNGVLHVSGLTVGKPWSIYNLFGQLIYTGIVVGDKADIPLPARGIYSSI